MAPITDEDIKRAIRELDGLPTERSIAKKINTDHKLIRCRMDANGELGKLQNEKGLEYIDKLDLRVRQRIMHLRRIGIKNQKWKDRINERLDEEILRPAILSYKKIPTVKALARYCKCDKQSVWGRLRVNDNLRSLWNQAGITYIDELSEEALKIEIFKTGGMSISCRDNEAWKTRLNERIDTEIVLPAIEKYDGLPSYGAIADKLECGVGSIKAHIENNKMLRIAQEKKGLEYINSLQVEILREELCKKGGLIVVAAYHEAWERRVYERFDTELVLPAIRDAEGIPSLREIGRNVNASGSMIASRLSKNPILFTALAQKQGLTIDQALELALGRGERTEATTRLFNERLTDLWAFREMVALVRVFADIFRDCRQVWEATLYPEPVGKALLMEGHLMPTRYVDLVDFKADSRIEIGLEATTGVVAVIQGIHRLTTERLTRLFDELHSILPEGSHVFATYSRKYGFQEKSEEAFATAGFSIQESGILSVELPEDTPLALPPEELRKVRKKIEGESNVVHMITTTRTELVAIPTVSKIVSEQEIESRVHANGEETSIPVQAIKDMKALFSSVILAEMPKEPIIVTVVDGNTNVAVLGFDMNPKRPKSVEAGVWSTARDIGIDFRAEARKIAQHAERRRELGIRSGRENIVPLTKLRR